MQEITDLIVEFKDITIELIDFLKIKNYDEISLRINRRQEIIEQLQNLKCNKEELVNKANEMNILELDKKVLELIHEDIDCTKEKLVQIKNVEFVKDKYYHRISNNPIFFNKKI